MLIYKIVSDICFRNQILEITWVKNHVAGIPFLENLSPLDGDTTCLVRIWGPCWQHSIVFECPGLNGKNPLPDRGSYLQHTCLSESPSARSRYFIDNLAGSS